MKTLFILHGWQSSKEKWDRVKEHLEKSGIRVIVPDLPGFKEENKINKPWNISDYVEWFERLINDQDKFFLLGHSFGGRVSIKFAARNPERLKGLILVSSAGIKKKIPGLLKFVKKLRFFSFLPGYNFFRKLFYRFILGKTDYLLAKGNLRETFKNVINEDLTPYLEKIKVPTLIIWGEKDRTTPISDAYLMKEKIKGSRLEILENIGHTPYLENPKVLSQKIKDFVENI